MTVFNYAFNGDNESQSSYPIVQQNEITKSQNGLIRKIVPSIAAGSFILGISMAFNPTPVFSESTIRTPSNINYHQLSRNNGVMARTHMRKNDKTKVTVIANEKYVYNIEKQGYNNELLEGKRMEKEHLHKSIRCPIEFMGQLPNKPRDNLVENLNLRSEELILIKEFTAKMEFMGEMPSKKRV